MRYAYLDKYIMSDIGRKSLRKTYQLVDLHPQVNVV